MQGQGRTIYYPIQVSVRHKAHVCGSSIAGIAGSYPAGGMEICVVCCTVWAKDRSQEVRIKYKDRTKKIRWGHGCLFVCCAGPLRQADHSSRGVLPTVRLSLHLQ
jgi:hypothetical protein